MQKHVDAVFENGVFKPVYPVVLKEHERVHLIIEETVSVAEATSGMIPARNSRTVDIIALEPEFLPEEV